MKAVPADYQLVSPGSLPAVLNLLAQEPGVWTPIAGGTELMVQFGAGRLKPRHLVNIFGLPELTKVTLTPDSIIIGAGVTYATLRNNPEVSGVLPLLSRAASWTGSPANQNRGTLGGNLVNASPAADSPPALLAYNASLELVSAHGTRRVPYSDFHTAYKQSLLGSDELVLAIHIPRPPAGAYQYLRKVGPRNAQAISKVALGAIGSLVDQRIQGVRLGLASVSHAPFRCRQTEAMLNESPLTPATIAEARNALVAEITPLDDIRSTGRYRTQVAANLLEEFLQQLSMHAQVTE